MQEDIITMLTAFGITVTADDALLPICVDNVQYQIRHETNLELFPKGLENIAISMAAGEYLRMKKAIGQLEGFDLEAAVKQIQEGDTNTVFAIGEGSMTPEERLDALIDYLLHGRSHELYRYRRLVW